MDPGDPIEDATHSHTDTALESDAIARHVGLVDWSGKRALEHGIVLALVSAVDGIENHDIAFS